MKTFTEWQTPKALFKHLDTAAGGFAVDAAANKQNALIERYYGPGSPLGEDALAIPEWLSPAWCNPPYGKGITKWVDKFLEQGQLGVSTVALLPAYTDRHWWYEKIVQPGADIIFLVGRVQFERPCKACSGTGKSMFASTPPTPAEGSCAACNATGSVPGTQPYNASAIVVFGPTAAGRTGWLDWRKKLNAEVAGDGDPNGQGPGFIETTSLGEG